MLAEFFWGPAESAEVEKRVTASDSAKKGHTSASNVVLYPYGGVKYENFFRDSGFLVPKLLTIGGFCYR